jgi:hypothetical protein
VGFCVLHGLLSASHDRGPLVTYVIAHEGAPHVVGLYYLVKAGVIALPVIGAAVLVWLWSMGSARRA